MTKGRAATTTSTVNARRQSDVPDNLSNVTPSPCDRLERSGPPNVDRAACCGVLISNGGLGGRWMAIDSRLKTALDESRLLILGAQVLFGFQFEAVFQELFPEISAPGRIVHCAGLVMLLISIGLLIAPSLFHQIVFDGESRPGAVTTATVLAGASLLP